MTAIGRHRRKSVQISHRAVAASSSSLKASMLRGGFIEATIDTQTMCGAKER
jgi:hypothetical protein